MKVLTETEIRDLVPMKDAITAVEGAFASLTEGRAQLPAVIHFEFPEANGDAHVKGAHLTGSPYFVVKIASGFYNNPSRGLTVGSGLVMAFDAETGQPQALLLDNGFLTDLRTGAAAGVSAKYLANQELSKIAFVGSGVEARFSARALAEVRPMPECQAWSRSRERAEEFAREMSDELGIRVSAVDEAEQAVRDADLVITATPSHDPIVKADWLTEGVHVIALGSDGAEKQELDVGVLARADIVIADRLSQCLEAGEIHHAVEAGVLTTKDIAGELGDVITGKTRGRGSPNDLTVCDLTGVGVQDAAVAALAIAAADQRGLGAEMSL
jgi:ectoine utilization protein EutC